MNIDDTNQYSWHPVLEVNNVKKSVDQVYWPVCVKGYRLLYVLLNGESKPAVFPQPVVSTCQFKIPIVEIRESTKLIKDKDVYNETTRSMLLEDMKTTHAENDKFEIEELICNGQNDPASQSLLDQLEAKCKTFQLESDRNVLKVYQRACQQNKAHLAVDLVMRYLRGPKSLEAAIKIANHHGRANVARIVDTYAKNMLELEAEPESSQPYPLAQSSQPQSQIQFHTLKPALKASSGIDDSGSARKLTKRSTLPEVPAVTPEAESPVVSSPPRVKFSAVNQYSQPPESPSYSDDVPDDTQIVPEANKKLPLNPFMIQGKNNNPSLGKRKAGGNIFDDIKNNLTASPSPAKKPYPAKLNTLSGVSNKLAF